MSTARFYLPQAPWFYVAVTSPSDITNFGWSLANRDPLRVVVRFLRGRKMSNIDGLHNEFGAALQFPWYYGENWAAFDECINDLDWMPADFYVLIVTDAEEVLSKEDGEQFSILIKTLQEAAVEWGCRLETTDRLRRLAVSFHVIFQSSEDQKDEFFARLQSTGASYQELNIETTA